ncbi:MAG: hypothetical protein ACPLSJ_07585 [Thermosulfidibacteraceae bacterium]
MLTREEIKKILSESPLFILFSPEEVDKIVDEIFNRYGGGAYAETYSYQTCEGTVCQEI